MHCTIDKLGVAWDENIFNKPNYTVTLIKIHTCLDIVNFTRTVLQAMQQKSLYRANRVGNPDTKFSAEMECRQEGEQLNMIKLNLRWRFHHYAMAKEQLLTLWNIGIC